jgi:choline dehydrogenase-like flavoprotein
MGGTCRMGDDPRTAVVDRNLRAHDHPNLYIVGAATFPTITASPPTLTIAAFALRAGLAIRRDLGAA